MTRQQMIRQRLVELLDALLAETEDWLLPDAQDSTAHSDHEHANARPVDRARTLDDLIDALVRIDVGTYGTCEECGNAIGYLRLLDFPTTQRCEACALEQWRPSPPG